MFFVIILKLFFLVLMLFVVLKYIISIIFDYKLCFVSLNAILICVKNFWRLICGGFLYEVDPNIYNKEIRDFGWRRFINSRFKPSSPLRWMQKKRKFLYDFFYENSLKHKDVWIHFQLKFTWGLLTKKLFFFHFNMKMIEKSYFHMSVIWKDLCC